MRWWTFSKLAELTKWQRWYRLPWCTDSMVRLVLFYTLRRSGKVYPTGLIPLWSQCLRSASQMSHTPRPTKEEWALKYLVCPYQGCGTTVTNIKPLLSSFCANVRGWEIITWIDTQAKLKQVLHCVDSLLAICRDALGSICKSLRTSVSSLFPVNSELQKLVGQ